MYIYNEDGSIKESNSGTPCGRFANSLDFENGHNGIRDNPIYHFSTPVHTYNVMNDAQKIVTNEIKRFLNNRPMAAMWHNGNSDKDCQFHGLNLHVVMHSAYKIIDSAPCKRLKKKLAAYGISLRTQNVNKALALLAHLQKEPRVLLGSNNLMLCAKLI